MILKNLICFLSNQSIPFQPTLDKLLELDKLNKLKAHKEKTEKKKINAYDKASDLFKDLLEIYVNE